MALSGFIHCFSAAPLIDFKHEWTCPEEQMSDRNYLVLRITSAPYPFVLPRDTCISSMSSLKMSIFQETLPAVIYVEPTRLT